MAARAEPTQELTGIDGAATGLEYAAHANEAAHVVVHQKAVLEEDAALLPAEQPRLDLERLQQLELAPELRERIGDDRQGAKAPGARQHTRAHEPSDATEIGERQVAPVVYVEIRVDIVRPDTQADARGLEQVDARLLESTRADTDHANPRVHVGSLQQTALLCVLLITLRASCDEQLRCGCAALGSALRSQTLGRHILLH